MLELLAMIADRVRRDDPAFRNYWPGEWITRCHHVAVLTTSGDRWWVGLHS